MRNCAIYSSQFDLDQLYEMIQSIYPDAAIQRREDHTHIQVIQKKWFSKNKRLQHHDQPDASRGVRHDDSRYAWFYESDRRA